MKKDLMIIITVGILFSGVFFPFVGWSQSAEHSTLTDDKTPPLGDVNFEMVYVEGGTFTMGCTSEQGDCEDDEIPTHQVTLSSFYIGKYEVTQAQWKAVMGSNPSLFKGDDLPVDQVSWNNIQDFIRKLNTKTGKRYRLPTEAEWEFAARGGNNSNGTMYSGTDSIDNAGWYGENSGKKTHPVGQKNANELGIYDMSGNLWEWCSDWYDHYSSGSQTNPKGPSSGSYRVLRGGSWYTTANDCRTLYRFRSTPDDRGCSIGFRLVLEENEIGSSNNNSDNNSSQTHLDMKVVSDDENTFTLSIPTNYTKTDEVVTADFAYFNYNNSTGVIGMKESVEDVEKVLGETSLRDYVTKCLYNVKNSVQDYHPLVDGESRTINNLNVLYCEYSITIEGTEINYMSIFYKTENYFYTIACLFSESQDDEYRDLSTSILNSFNIIGDVNFEMVYVKGGTFTMGCPSKLGDCDDDESPTHQVTLSSFYIGKYEVTQVQWKAVMGSNPSYFKGDSLPVENVNWDDIMEFIDKLNAKTGKHYRLPTEAEWEFAARGGNRNSGKRYSGADFFGNTGWYNENSDGKTHLVGQKNPNELGIYDMSGNVWEKCSDWYGSYSSSSQTNPKGPSSSSYCVLRGGGWDYDVWNCRVFNRSYVSPDYRHSSHGFRLVLEENVISPSYNNSDNNSSQTDLDMKVVSDDENTYSLSIPTYLINSEKLPTADFAYLNYDNRFVVTGAKVSVESIENLIGETSLRDYATKILNNIKNSVQDYHLLVDGESRTINNLNVLYCEYSITIEGNEINYMNIFYKTEKYFYTITCFYVVSQDDEYRDLSNSILNSFKITGDVNFEMVYVKGGTFTMGCTSEQNDCEGDESPTHRVKLSGFYIGKYEVTQAQWKAIMDTNPSIFNGDNLPVENVSWYDVMEFIDKLNAKTGKHYRLPTEAEWEFAARGGNKSRSYEYSGSNTLGDVGWNWNNSGDKIMYGNWDEFGQISKNNCRTHPVGQKLPNELGIYDMSGNVYEWCSNSWSEYSSDRQTNPTGQSTDSDRMFRGGSWGANGGFCRVSKRSAGIPEYSDYYIGFRLVLDQ